MTSGHAAGAQSQPTTDKWCMLSVRGASTLKLARSLRAGGIDAWAPRGWVERRIRTTDARVEIETAIAPGYVFVNGGSTADRFDQTLGMLWGLSEALFSPHPRFTVFDWYGSTPRIGAAGLRSLRTDEDEHQVASDRRKLAEEARVRKIAEDKQRRAALNEMRERNALQRKELQAVRAMAPNLLPGDKVTIDRPEMVGLIGTVRRTVGHVTTIVLGNALEIVVETWQLHPSRINDPRAA